MSPRFDVAARLAEGRPAVEHAQTYVSACRALGYQHPDLTAHDRQVLDWYETEDGLDLHALEGDWTALRAAANAAEEALTRQREQIAELAAAWRGPGADAAMQFLRRHCDAAGVVVARVRAAADGYGELRDKLWQAVDGKAATAIGVDDRSVAQRPAWLAAAHTVTTGSADRSDAEELVREQVMPYVDNDIRNDWLTVMHSTTASAAAAYDAAVDALTAVPGACFAIPGDLGPQAPREELLRDEPAPLPMAAPPASTVPAALPPPSPPPPLPAGMPDEPTPPPLSDLAAPLGDAAGMSSGAGGLGSLGGLGGGIGGVVGAIVDGIGGLLGSLADGLADPSASDDLPFDDELDADEPLEQEDDKEVDDDAATPDENPTATEEVADETDPPAAEPPPPPEPPPAEPPPAEQRPAEQPAAAPPEESTPCEIAADELPQAGQ
ncbi:hypothetical protein MFM001_33840 [Mycobacterium sp. MFM001]|uniref:hypothetical protein n=1 Tax=Mycobacterium sp. MFM001 TaxID=2049453 RepID=UPI000DA516FE|nr:hypothetical protein [Mycobacterium sp. MFM001]GBE66922.1 hypothetical protein MFM001_33840 [Mycobacterium sp. MFM001]